jgi:hypothetical protein
MDIMKVRSLVDNRIRGIRSDEVAIKLKPTLFNDRSCIQEIPSVLATATFTPAPCGTSTRLKNKKPGLSPHDSNENIRHTSYETVRAFTAKVNSRSKKFRMVAPPREHYQSYINRSSDPYVFTRCQTGKTRKIRAVF